MSSRKETARIFFGGAYKRREIEKIYAAPDKERLLLPIHAGRFHLLYLIFEALAVEHVLLEEAVEVGVERSGT